MSDNAPRRGAAVDPEITRLFARVEALGLRRADLGRALQLDSKQVNRLANGERRLQLGEAREAQSWLDGVEADRRGGESSGSVGAIVPMPGMVPLYGWVGAASPNRLTLAEQSVRGFVPAHPAQQHTRDAFALEVADISMSPRYEPGEIVYVAANRWPKRGQDVVIVTSDGQGLLKRLVRREENAVILHQLNPESEFSIDIEDVAEVHAVVGRG